MTTYGQLEVVLSREDAESFCDWVREHWAVEPVCLEQPRDGRSVVDIYFDTEADAEARKGQLPDDFAFTSVESMTCHPKQWTTFWRHHFHIQDIGKRFRTVPVWETAPDEKRINLLIDPGLSFGTGDHFTTRFCLEELERACEALKPNSVMDAGTGSGILAIAAAKLGVPQIEAFDYDPICVTQCEENASLNGLSADRIHFFEADVLKPSGWDQPADVICANILTNVLVKAAPKLWGATRKRLILTGIRECEGDEVVDAFLPGGVRETRRDGDGEWCGIVLDR
jgi:ribosomal protein L11 methyltransferase